MASRRTTGEGSIYQRQSDGRWIGVVDLGWVAGKRVRKTVSAPTLKELRPKFRRLKDQIEKGVVTDETTVAAWMEKWLTTVANERVRPSTLKTYEGYTRTWILPHLGHLRLDRLRPDHLRSLYATMKEQGKKDATRRQVHAIIRRALVVAERDGLIASNPAAKVDAPEVGKGSHGKFTLPEARLILAALDPAPPFLEIPMLEQLRWSLALLEGMRQGEALGLRWDDFDLNDGTISIQRAAQRVTGQGLVTVGLKSESSYRAIPMVAPVEELVQKLHGRSGFVFSVDGKQLRDPRRDWQAWKDLLVMAQVPTRPLHAARATTASLLDAAGVSDKIIAEIMGHSQVQITQKHYIHGDIERHRDALGGMVKMIRGDEQNVLPASPPATS